MGAVGSLLQYFSLIHLTTGRRIFALNAMLGVALEHKLHQLVEPIEDAIAFNRDLFGLEERWDTVRDNRSTRRGDAVIVDNKLDQTLHAIATVASGHASGDIDTPHLRAGKHVLEKLYPNGVTAITQQSFEDQLESVVHLLKKCDDDRGLSDDIRLLGLEDRITQIKALTSQLRVELEKKPQAEVTWDKVRAAQLEGHERYVGNVALVIGTFWRRTQEHTDLREELLSEANRQSKIISDSRRRKVPVLDVDPETGEEIDSVPDGQLLDPEADAPTP